MSQITDYVGNSVGNTAGGSATGPAANAAVATIAAASLPQGVYLVQAVCGLGIGTMAAADCGNLNLRAGAVVIAGPIPVTGTTAGGNCMASVEAVVFLDGVTALTVNAIATSTGTAVYKASIVARRIK